MKITLKELGMTQTCLSSVKDWCKANGVKMSQLVSEGVNTDDYPKDANLRLIKHRYIKLTKGRKNGK